MRGLRSESGFSKLKVLIILGLLGLGISEGIKYLIVQLDYQRMKDTMEAQASAAQVLKDEEILATLDARSRELGLPMSRDNFLLTRDTDQGTMTLQTAWDVNVKYLWGICGERCDQTYHFELLVNESYIK